MAGPAISLPADALRSSGLEILGSGPGTIPLAEIFAAIPGFLALAAAGDLPIDIDEVPLCSGLASRWHDCRCGLEGQEISDADHPQYLAFQRADALPGLVVIQAR